MSWTVAELTIIRDSLGKSLTALRNKIARKKKQIDDSTIYERRYRDTRNIFIKINEDIGKQRKEIVDADSK